MGDRAHRFTLAERVGQAPSQLLLMDFIILAHMGGGVKLTGSSKSHRVSQAQRVAQASRQHHVRDFIRYLSL